ncbi:hypothetical protein SAMN04488120_11145 [Fontimonas thermophila]|uniref:PBP superfamily domain-containing protein n=1 Tax=Fontimonas thermophila TaxID=1076937 RepID=A0A1I2JY32_9GAMM|nr:hypothetical protein [Fontimonas thermophila]SFF59792.1 hypothetical protein SAMN04488120_11145 [Fontimonas thermophila]
MRRSRWWCAGALVCALLLPAARAEDAVIAVVVHPAVDTGRLDAEMLAQIYKRRRLYWRDGARIQPVNLPPDHPLRRRFSVAILGQLPEALDEYWNAQYFHGVLPPHVLASEEAVARFVRATPQAIGYLGHCWLGEGLRVVLTLDAQGRIRPPQAPLPACP